MNIFRLKKFLKGLGCSACLFSCCLSCPTMTAPAFERIPLGSPITEVEAQVGPPYSISSSPTGVQQYRYLERLETGPGTISQNTYLLTVVEGQVVNKQCSQDAQALNLQIR